MRGLTALEQRDLLADYLPYTDVVELPTCLDEKDQPEQLFEERQGA